MNWFDWIGIGIGAAILLTVIIINSNLIILNKNFIRFHDKFVQYIKAIIEFAGRQLENMRAPGLEQEKNTDQVAAPILIAHNANFIQRYRLLDEGASPHDTMEVLDLTWYERYNLVMLEIWVTRSFLKETLIEVFDGEVEPSDEELLEYVPPIACSRADVYGYVDDNGAIAFSADYNSEIKRFSLEDEDDDASE